MQVKILKHNNHNRMQKKYNDYNLKENNQTKTPLACTYTCELLISIENITPPPMTPVHKNLKPQRTPLNMHQLTH